MDISPIRLRKRPARQNPKRAERSDYSTRFAGGVGFRGQERRFTAKDGTDAEVKSGDRVSSPRRRERIYSKCLSLSFSETLSVWSTTEAAATPMAMVIASLISSLLAP